MSFIKRFLIFLCIILVSQAFIFADGIKTNSSKKQEIDFSSLQIINPQNTGDSFYYLGKLNVEEFSVKDWTKNAVYTLFNSDKENEGYVLPALVVGLIAETFASEQNKLIIKDMYKKNPSIFE